MFKRLFPLLFLSLIISTIFGQVVFNEIMYNPPGPDIEWLEFFNTSIEDVFLDGDYYIYDEEGTYYFEGITITGRGYLTVFAYPLLDTIDLYFTPDVDASGSGLQFNNSGEEIWLMHVSGAETTVVDYLAYDPAWGRDSDGDGKTLSRIDPDGETNDSTNWGASDDSLGTPGAENSVTIVKETVVLPKTLIITVQPNPFNAACAIDIYSETEGIAQMYNIAGRSTEYWSLSVGDNHILWTGENAPSGIHFLRVTNRTETTAIPVLIIR